MLKDRRNDVFRILCILVCLFLFQLMALNMWKMPEENRRVSAQKDQGYWTQAEILALWQAEQGQETPSAFTVWGQQDATEIQSVDLERTVRGDVLELMGDSSRVVTDPEVLMDGDKKGCLIGEQLAKKLFGSREVTGLEVNCEERILKIQGVLKEYPDILVVQWDGTGDSCLCRVNLLNPAEEELAGFLMRNNIDATRIEDFFLYDGIRICGELLPLSCFIWMLLKVLKRWRSGWRNPLVLVLVLTGVAAATGVFFWCFPLRLSLFRDFMPAKWSEFSYYGTYLQNKGAAFWRLCSMKKTAADQPLLILAGKMLLFAVCGEVSLYGAVHHNIKKYKKS
ncbi:MAG: ABC transporter permease [Lachnospiraceae bacterium]|nr:ABC transporter permease [Lachnospiraceae bacterium]